MALASALAARVGLGPLAVVRGTEGLMPFRLRLPGAVGNADFNDAIVKA